MKGSALDLNMMRYIHTKLWDAKLCEALVTKHMKPKIERKLKRKVQRYRQ